MEEWKEYKLGDVCTISSSKRIFASEYQNKGIPFYRGKEIIEKQNGSKISNELFISENRYNEIKSRYGAPKEGDMLLSSVGTLGVPYVVQNEAFYFKDGNLTWFYDFQGINNYFLYYWFLSPKARFLVDTKAIGSTQKALTIETLKKFDISLPPIDTQNNIVAILKSLDDKIEVNRRINDNLEQQAQALFKSWFVDFEPFRDQPFVESELGMIPEGWRVIQLIDIAEISKNSINPQKQPQTLFNHYSIPAFDEGMKPEIQLGEEIKSNKFVITNKITLFSKLNPRIKRVWYVDKLKSNSICSTEFVPYKAKDESQSSFLYSLINSRGFYDYVMSMVNGATGSHQRFHPEESLNYNIAFNYECVSKYCEVMSPIIHQMLENREESRRLAELRDNLLPRLMSGELSVDGLKGQFAVSPGQHPGAKEHVSNNTAL